MYDQEYSPTVATASFSLPVWTVHHLKQFSLLLLLLENKDCKSQPLFKLRSHFAEKLRCRDHSCCPLFYHPLWHPLVDLIWFLFSFWVFSPCPWVRGNIKSNVFWWVYLSESVKEGISNRTGSGEKERGRERGRERKGGRREREIDTEAVFFAWKGKLAIVGSGILTIFPNNPTLCGDQSASIFNTATDIASQSSSILPIHMATTMSGRGWSRRWEWEAKEQQECTR